MAYTPVVQDAECTVSINGTPLDADRVVRAEYEESWDLVVARGSVTILGKPTGLEFKQAAQIDVGPTAAEKRTRFKGFVAKFRYTPDLPSTIVTIPLEGHLGRARRYKVPTDAGTTEVPGKDMVNGGAGATDQAQVRTVLTDCNLGAYYTAANIGGTGRLLGTQTGTNTRGVRQHFVWPRGVTGLEYLTRLDRICLGFRTYDSLGEIVRRQITARPRVTAVATFTEGVDLFDDTEGEHDVDEAFNRITVQGFDYGDGPVRVTVSAPHPKPESGVTYLDWQDGDSPMIERDLESSPGLGLSCEAVAYWHLDRLNHVRLSSRYSTYRGDLIRAGDTIDLLADSGMEIYQSMFVRGVKGVWDSQGWTQYLDVVAPAEVGRGGASFWMRLSGAKGGRAASLGVS